MSLTAPLGAGAEARAPLLLTVGPVRALVVSPHPDDATLAAGGLMQRILRAGGSVRVVQMTGGDGFPRGVTTLFPRVRPTPISYRHYGSVREREAIRALRRLGIHRSRIRLLGFPDEGLCLLGGADLPFTSPYTRRESPPASEQIIPGATYRQEDLVRELARLIEAFRPTLIVLPHAGDEHPDHCATHLLVHRALSEALDAGVRQPRLLHYVLHYPTWPAQPGDDKPQSPPIGGHADEWQWRSLALTAAERAGKGRALDAYRSQMLVMADFLASFRRSNELFIEGEPASALPCWCNGENISPTATGSR
ncbi:MAG: PIG-L deacetylase family protein [Vicinamibacterales bacterium]